MSVLAGFAGRYGPFVWTAYAAAAAIFAWMIIDTVISSARSRRRLAVQERALRKADEGG